MRLRWHRFLALALTVALLAVQQAGSRHALAHSGGTPPSVAAADGELRPGTPGESRERVKVCVECLALHGLDLLPGGGFAECPPGPAQRPIAVAAAPQGGIRAPEPKAQSPPLPA